MSCQGYGWRDLFICYSSFAHLPMMLHDLFRNTVITGRNLLRSLRRKELDFVVLSIHGSYPERTVRRDPLPFPFSHLPLFPTEVSLEDMRMAMEMIGNDRRIQGVVLRFGTLRSELPTLHSLRRMLLDLRARGKRIVAWLPIADASAFYLASACDEVVLPPSGRFFVPGLRAEPVFLKDTLALIGVEADFEAIAEYKVAPDTYRRSTMSEPHREMLNAILDSYFDEIIAAIAEGRGLEVGRVRELVDAMPLSPSEAVEAGLADAVLYEDELAAHLSPSEKTPEVCQASEAPIALLPWPQATRWLRQPVRWTTRQLIGVVSLEGLIVPGRSRRIPMPLPVPLPFVEAQAGAETITRMLRYAETDGRIAAVILHIETPGGSALASDLICREVRRLQERKPVVVLMGNQVAFGVASSSRRGFTRSWRSVASRCNGGQWPAFTPIWPLSVRRSGRGCVVIWARLMPASRRMWPGDVG